MDIIKLLFVDQTNMDIQNMTATTVSKACWTIKVM